MCRKRWILIAVVSLLLLVSLCAGGYWGIDTAYHNGYASGQQSGYMHGKRDGYALGSGDGTKSGYHRGYADGSTQGYADGYQKGHTQGYTDGQNDGSSSGYSTGYDQGKRDALTLLRDWIIGAGCLQLSSGYIYFKIWLDSTNVFHYTCIGPAV